MIRVMFSMILLALAGCDRPAAPGGTVVLYSSIDDTYARMACREFEGETGIHVDLVTDSEAAKSTGLVQRLIAEKAKPVADVFWSGDPMRAFKLEVAGVGRIAATSGPARVRVIVYNTKLVAADQVPRRVADLAGPEAAKRACMANPLFGSTSLHAAALLQMMGAEKAGAFFIEFVRNGGRMLASNGEVKRRVSSGEFAFGLTDSDDVAVALGEGKPVGFVVPDQDEGDVGAVLVPAVPVVIHGAPHAEVAERLAAWLAGERMQQVLAESDAEFLPGSSDVKAVLKHLKLERGALKAAAAMTAGTSAEFEAWEHCFLESWVAQQSR
ncbi:MAG: extracellular solute-binding protein [Verrucomicrobiota bacterium]